MKSKEQVEKLIEFHKEALEKSKHWEKQRHLTALEILAWVKE